MSSGSDFEDEVRASKKTKATAKRKRSKKLSDSDEDISLDEESDWEAQEYTARSNKRPKGGAEAANKGRGRKGDDDEDDALNEEDLFDEEDRKKLEGMTELEREMMIAEAAEKRQQELQRKKLLKQTETDDQPAAVRKSGREVREEKAKKSAMEELKAARKRKTKGIKSKIESEDEEEEAAPSAAALDEYPSDMEEGEDLDAGRYHGYRGAEEDEEASAEAAIEDVRKIVVKRHRLEEWFNKPFFESTMPGCMVKVVIDDVRGPDGRPQLRADGKPDKVYMLAQVVDVEDRPPGSYKFKDKNAYKSPYPFGSDGKTATRTSKWIRIVRGYSEKLWPMALVSNEGITDREFEKWHAQNKKDRKSQITIGEVKEVLSRLENAANYTYTAEDVAKLLAERRGKGLAPVNLVAEKARLEQAKAAAVEEGDEAKIHEIQALIDQVDAQAAAASSKRRLEGPSMAELNRKNAELNVKATALGHGGADAAGGVGGSTLDPFKRRATRSVIYWKTKKEEEDGVGYTQEEEVQEQGGDDEAAAVDNEALEAAVADLVDLSGLDLSVLDQPPRVHPMARKLLGSLVLSTSDEPSFKPKQGGRALSLQEYQAMRGGRIS